MHDRATTWLRVPFSEGDAGTVGAPVVAQLQVHRVDVSRQVTLRLVGDAGAVGARVLAQLQVHRVDERVKGALLPEADAIAVGAPVRPHLLLDNSAVLSQVTRLAEAAAAVRALVVVPCRLSCTVLQCRTMALLCPKRLLLWGHL